MTLDFFDFFESPLNQISSDFWNIPPDTDKEPVVE